MHTTRMLGLGALMLAIAGSAPAAEQTILGTSITVKNPGAVEKRKVVIKAKEKASTNTIVGDPVGGTGGALTVVLSGGTSTFFEYQLLQGTSAITGKPFWSGDATTGFKYKDAKGENGVVRSAQIKRTSSGTFTIKAVLSGKYGTVGSVPPNPGQAACVALRLSLGDRYQVRFGFGDGLITNKGAILYKHKKVLNEGQCLFISSTTTSTLVTTTTSTTTTTLYGSPSRAFMDPVPGLLD